MVDEILEELEGLKCHNVSYKDTENGIVIEAEKNATQKTIDDIIVYINRKFDLFTLKYILQIKKV